MKNGYLEMINRGVAAVRNFQNEASFGYGTREARIQSLKEEIRDADSIVIGAGAGLSTSAGFVYNGERFRRWFSDFADKYGFQDMYSGGFYPYKTREEFWAYWARYIYINRYLDAPIPVYEKLLKLVQEKDYFIITTNVDHCFQKAGFDKRRLFYTQGDYGLFQSSRPSSPVTYDNEEWVMQAMEAQGYLREKEGIFKVPEGKNISMSIPTELIPICPDDGLEMTMNLRSDDTFVEDEGWHRASAAYADFLDRNNDRHVLYLELGVGQNTPVFYVLNPIRPKMAKNSRFYPENGYFIKELSRITDSERLRRCA